MKTQTLTIRLDAKLAKSIDRASRATGQSRSELARRALRSQLLLDRFDALRAKTLPYASKAGYLLDEDVFRDVS